MSQALADVHRIQQVRTVAETEALIAEVFRRTIRPGRVEETYPVFLRAAELLLDRGRRESHRIARGYYLAEAAARGLPAPAEGLVVATLGPGQAEAALQASGATAARAASAKGLPPAEVLRAGQLAVAGSAKRLVLNAGREYLVNASILDPAADGFARISDGRPCHFCAMLVSRGPVYSRDTANFEAHDKCGCGVRLVYPDDPDGGWSNQARAQESLWDATGDLSTFRRATRAARTGTEKGLLQRLADEGVSDAYLSRIQLAMRRVRRLAAPESV